MKKQPIKLYDLHLHVETEGCPWYRVEVSARNAVNAVKIATDSVARKCRILPSKVEAYRLELLRSTDWTTERLYRYR